MDAFKAVLLLAVFLCIKPSLAKPSKPCDCGDDHGHRPGGHHGGGCKPPPPSPPPAGCPPGPVDDGCNPPPPPPPPSSCPPSPPPSCPPSSCPQPSCPPSSCPQPSCPPPKPSCPPTPCSGDSGDGSGPDAPCGPSKPPSGPGTGGNAPCGCDEETVEVDETIIYVPGQTVVHTYPPCGYYGVGEYGGLVGHGGGIGGLGGAIGGLSGAGQYSGYSTGYETIPSYSGVSYGSGPKNREVESANIDCDSFEGLTQGYSNYMDSGSYDSSGKSSGSDSGYYKAITDQDYSCDSCGSFKHCYKKWDNCDISVEKTSTSSGTAMCKEMNLSKDIDYNNDKLLGAAKKNEYDSDYSSKSDYCSEATEGDLSYINEGSYSSDTEEKDVYSGPKNINMKRGSGNKYGGHNDHYSC